MISQQQGFDRLRQHGNSENPLGIPSVCGDSYAFRGILVLFHLKTSSVHLAFRLKQQILTLFKRDQVPFPSSTFSIGLNLCAQQASL